MTFGRMPKRGNQHRIELAGRGGKQPGREFIVRPRHTAFRIAFALSRVKAGAPIGDVCDVVGISVATFRHWKRKYDGLRPAEVFRLRRLENENRKLKRQLAKLLGTGWRLHDSPIRGARR